MLQQDVLLSSLCPSMDSSLPQQSLIEGTWRFAAPPRTPLQHNKPS